MNAANPVPIPKPTALKPNDLLKMHGPMGGLVRQLQRFAVLGWVLFVVTFALFWLLVAISTLAPKTIIVVDEHGHLVGEYRDKSTRSDDDYVAAGVDFLRDYLSLNSSTIFEDYARALNMMTPELRGEKYAAIKRDGYLERVRSLRAKSRLDFDAKVPPQILERSTNRSVVRFRGYILTQLPTHDGVEAEEKRQPFDITLVLVTTQRTTANAHGVSIASTKDN